VRLSRHYPSASEDIRLSVRETAEGFQLNAVDPDRVSETAVF